MRTAAEDLYYHGVRLVVANIIWGIGALLTAFLLTRSVLGFVALAAMVPLTAGLMGMATALVRERTIVMTDFTRPLRTRFWAVLALGGMQLAMTALVVFDLLLGIQLGGILGFVLAMVAVYTGLAVWVLASAMWPIVTDPERRADSLRSGMRLGALLVLAHPVRMGLMAVVLAAITLVSAILAAAILTFAAVYVALVAAHFVLPSADRLEGRETMIVEAPES